MTQETFTKSDLKGFSGGGDVLYRHSLARRICYTLGVEYVAKNAEAYWLIDEIAFSQIKPVISAEGFQVWRLTVKADKTAKLTCEDGNKHVIASQLIKYTDFPLDDITFYCVNNIILLPSEY